ncbi:hypothetical protein NCAS_0A03500 [Naumovozyma castellii]|uniref:Uncharacterized protein n=1 Tax=Naumovozyma castellii TaxID=27288 RepID=G0V618_NAUCA|nr:hypothetical protein NCAS_0A03500 [Naumovozyma castellii CBS 4309]CCC66908.1 hypothetical protein NCAS_0A03500 [Naumovozyma castellii CBS 4309]
MSANTKISSFSETDSSSSLVKKNYYEVIAGLAELERSQDITFTKEELYQLTKPVPLKKAEAKSKRHIVHAYLGGNIDIKDTTEYDLSHTLLGTHVPQKQLEMLSSIDFAQLFHKTLECENALQINDMFFDGLTPSPRKSDPQDSKEATTKGVRKVVVCKRCQSRFKGPLRMKQLEKHTCNTRRRH